MDLNDNLDDFLSEIGNLEVDLRVGHAPIAERGAMKDRVLSGKGDRWQAAGPAIHKDTCESCKGTGRFRAWTGRDLGECFKCKGKGFKMFKTSAESRRVAREKTAERKNNDRKAFRDAHNDVLTWLEAESTRQLDRAAAGLKAFDLPNKLWEAFVQWGSLTERQLEVATDMMVKSKARLAEWKAKKEAAKAAAQDIDVSRIDAAFEQGRAKAAKDGERVKWQHLQLAWSQFPDQDPSIPDPTLRKFDFADAPANGRWPACIWVKEGSRKLGKIEAGKFHKFDCDADTEAKVLELASKPFEGAKLFGQRVGECSCCGRELTNKESRKAGIGPICARKHGWA